MSRQLFLVLGLLCICACSNDTDQVNEAVYGYDYFPLDVGVERIYKMDSLIFDAVNNRPALQEGSSFLREVVVDQFTNDLEEEVFIIERYLSDSPEGPWAIRDVVSEQRELNQAYRVENNLRFIPLVFPINKNTSWNGTVFIQNGYNIFVKGELLEDVYNDWIYEVTEMNGQGNYGGNTYDNLIVVEANDENKISIRRQSLTYASGVGLVYGETWILNSICKHELSGDTQFCEGLTWEEKASRGFIVRQELISFK